MHLELIRRLFVYIPLLLVLSGLFSAIILDTYLGKKNRSIMLLVAVLTIVLVLEDGIGHILATTIVNPPARTWCSIVGYSVRPVILLLFMHIVGIKRKAWPFWVLIGVNALIHLTALFTGRICFGFPGNNFYRGPLGYTAHIVSGIMLACLLFNTIREYSRAKRAETWIPVLNALLVVIAVILDSFVFIHLEGPASFTTIATACCTLFYYIWLHLQFVREHEQSMMAEQRIQIMMTQIQPHFLFNTLNTIRALYAIAPPLADRTLEEFSVYLRQNLDSLNQSDLIPFSRELEHTRIYTDIEMLRFPNIRVEYRIDDEQFEVPALTVQPLVENAINHGVRGQKDGLVTVSTVRDANVHRIEVRDNGGGFDTETLGSAGKTHIGLRNVKDRVEQMCQGTLILQSEIGKGTIVTLLIPDKTGKDRKEKRV